MYKEFSTGSTTDDSEEKTRQFGKRIENILLCRGSTKKVKPSRIFKEPMPIEIEQPQIVTSFPSELQDYALDISQYVETREANSIISEDYMEWQTDINSFMRDILVGWLIEVTSGLGLKHQTLHLAVLLVDKYCYCKNIIKRKYQVLGGACMFIAAKFEEVAVPRLSKYIDIADGAYFKNELLAMESDVLTTLCFNLQEKSTFTFFEIKAKEYELSKSVRAVGNMLMEMCLIEYRFCGKRPKYLALSIVFCAMALKKKKFMSLKSFVQANQLEENIFVCYLEEINGLFMDKGEHKFTAVRKRYSNLLISDSRIR